MSITTEQYHVASVEKDKHKIIYFVGVFRDENGEAVAPMHQLKPVKTLSMMEVKCH